jgi:hypothetical protein
MRVPMKFLLAAALVMPAGFVASNAVVAGAAGGTKCAKSSGTATFKPPLPKSGDSTKVKPKIIVKNGKTTGCTGGGVTSSKFTSLAKFHDGTNCDTLLSGNPGPNPPTGTINTKWNTGATSVASVTLNPVSGSPTKTHVTGTVTSGLFNGKHLDVTLSFAPKTGDCVTTDLSQVTFTNDTPLKIS